MLDIQDFTKFTAAHFVAKCHAVNFANIPALPLVLEIELIQSLLPKTAYVWIGTKTDLKTKSFVAFESSRFVVIER